MIPYVAPVHLAIVRFGKLANDREVDFWVEAVRTQLREHVAPAWGLPPPGVFAYAKQAYVDQGRDACVVAVVDDEGDDEAAGFHTMFGSVPYGFVDLHQSGDEPSVVLSHEAIEMFANAYLDRWAPGPAALDYAVELCDAVQRDNYAVPVEMFGERRDVAVSDFVLPAWFNPTASPPYRQAADQATLAPFTNAFGGYSIAKDSLGRVVYLSHPGGAIMAARKLKGRTGRLIAGGAL